MFSIDLLCRSYVKINFRRNIIFFMTNTDYLLKAAIKKLTEKLNEILVEKIEEATNIAQDAPEILKKEFDSLKESIIEEASRLEKAENIEENESANTCLLYTSPSPRDRQKSRMPSSA